MTVLEALGAVCSATSDEWALVVPKVLRYQAG